MRCFPSLLPHGTPPNESASRRRALQWHLLPRGARRLPPAQRLAAFGGEGLGVEC